MPAQQYGCFYVYGSHITDPAPSDMIPVLVDAATAFGSGEHPTTAGCLTMLAKLSEGKDFKRVLDMGCGSGILGIAAKKRCTGADVTMIDNDPESIRVSNHNAARNSVDVSCYVSEGFADGAVQDLAGFDLILANILAKPVCALAPDFALKTTPGGFVVVSGLLSRHTDMVCEHYVAAGFSMYEQKNINDWMSLVFQK
jgi:ribosomal protein L11 methyltransferase